MPLAVDNVPYSELKGSNLHQGPRTAGNKSMLSYRSDIGIPGYTGYCPGWSTVPGPIHGSNQHTGRLPAGTLQAQEALQHADQQQHASEYRCNFTADLSAYHAPTKSGGGHWFEERQRQAAASHNSGSGGGAAGCLAATTTYRAEMLRGPETQQQQRQQLEGLPITLVGYQAARDRSRGVRSAGSPAGTLAGTGGHPAGALSATTAATSTGLIGYRTTYSNTNRALEEAAAAAASAGSLRPHTCPGGGTERLRMAVMPGVATRFEGSSAYSRDFGPLGSDPMALAARQPGQQAGLATTGELNAGTSRACRQPPGYTGFIPAAGTNGLAVQQAAGLTSRPNGKHAMLPHALDQFSRGAVTHYTGYKPKGGAAATSVLRPKGPTTETTQGFVNLQVLNRGPQRVDHTHCINSRTGLMSFFTGGGESVSDNGLADAQRFFAGRRPLGGRMQHA